MIMMKMMIMMIMMIMINTSKTTRFYIFSFKCRKDHCRVNMNSFCIISYNKTKNNLSFETKIFIVCYSNIFTLISELLSMQILPVFLLPRSINFNLGIISKFPFLSSLNISLLYTFLHMFFTDEGLQFEIESINDYWALLFQKILNTSLKTQRCPVHSWLLPLFTRTWSWITNLAIFLFKSWPTHDLEF